MTPVLRITCEICPGPFFHVHPRIKLRARIAHGGGRRPAWERGYFAVRTFSFAVRTFSFVLRSSQFVLSSFAVYGSSVSFLVLY